MRPLLVSLLAAAALALQAPVALGSADPIEGVWLYGGGAIRVSSTGPGSFVGVVVAATKFTECVHPRGQRMWEMAGEDGMYLGTHVGWGNMETCTPESHAAKWIVRSEDGRSILDFCADAANAKCYPLQRVDEYSYSVDLRAEPADSDHSAGLLSPFYVLSRLVGSGRLLDSEELPNVSPSGTIVLENQNLGAPDERITLRPTRVNLVDASRSYTIVNLVVQVKKSTLPGCKAGSKGALRLRDNANGPDTVVLGLCGAVLMFVHEPRSHDVVKVSIRSSVSSAEPSSDPSQPSSPAPGTPIEL